MESEELGPGPPKCLLKRHEELVRKAWTQCIQIILTGSMKSGFTPKVKGDWLHWLRRDKQQSAFPCELKEKEARHVQR